MADTIASSSLDVLRALSHRYSTATISSAKLLRIGDRNRLVRYDVDGVDDVASIVVKHMIAQPERGFDDWAGLAFIESLGIHPPVAPHLHDGDVERRFFILEDLGDAPSLDTLLRGDDRRAAVDALVDLARTSGRLQQGSIGRVERFLSIRASLPFDVPRGHELEMAKWVDALPRMAFWFDRCDVAFDRSETIEKLSEVYLSPGPFLCFTHGDMAPSNSIVHPDDVLLLDFEYCGYRHALYDLAVWRTLCPLPEEITDRMIETWREEYFRSTTPPNDALFGHHWNSILCWRAIAMLGWFDPAIIDEDKPWVEEWSSRAALLQTLVELEAAASDSLPSLARSAGELANELARRWPGVGPSMPMWNVFS